MNIYRPLDQRDASVMLRSDASGEDGRRSHEKYQTGEIKTLKIAIAQGLCPYGPADLPHWLCLGSISSAEPTTSWRHRLRRFYAATAHRRQPHRVRDGARPEQLLKINNVCRLAFCLFALGSFAFSAPAFSADVTPPAAKKPERSQPPVRLFDAPGAPTFTRLDGKSGVNPPTDADGDFLIGPEYVAAPERKAVEGVPQGKVEQFTLNSKDGTLFNPGIARNVFGTMDPNNPKTLIVETHQIDYMRTITVYIPAQYVPGAAAPFIVTHDGPKLGSPDKGLATIFDNLIAQRRIPAMIAIMVANGGGDAQGHERGREYDTMSGLYAEYIETHILPQVEKNYNVKLTKDPEGRATMGNSSGGSAALIMAWYRPDLYHRVLTFSGTFVNQQWPFNPETPDGAWGFHNKLIPESDRKPLRIFLSVGDRDNFNPNVMRDDMHDWVEANHRMAKVLKAKGYPYQYIFCQNAGHGLGSAKGQILPHALEWLWKGYPIQAP